MHADQHAIKSTDTDSLTEAEARSKGRAADDSQLSLETNPAWIWVSHPLPVLMHGAGELQSQYGGPPQQLLNFRGVAGRTTWPTACKLWLGLRSTFSKAVSIPPSNATP